MVISLKWHSSPSSFNGKVGIGEGIGGRHCTVPCVGAQRRARRFHPSPATPWCPKRPRRRSSATKTHPRPSPHCSRAPAGRHFRSSQSFAHLEHPEEVPHLHGGLVGRRGARLAVLGVNLPAHVAVVHRVEGPLLLTEQTA